MSIDEDGSGIITNQELSKFSILHALANTQAEYDELDQQRLVEKRVHQILPWWKCDATIGEMGRPPEPNCIKR